MKKIKKIFFIELLIILILTINTYAKYNYSFNINAFSLKRDSSEIVYNISRTENKYINKDVLLTIDFNKKVQKIDGFEISKDGKTLTRLITKNENKTIVVEDISGNKKDISYSVDNIDKIPPEIIGIDDEMTYFENRSINYTDNIGIKEISVDLYSNLCVQCYQDYYDTNDYKGIDVIGDSIKINVIAHPKNTKYYKYYLNGNAVAKTSETMYKFTGLQLGTTYNIGVEALDKNEVVLERKNQNIVTKFFTNIKVEKIGNSDCNVKLYGLDNRIGGVVGVGYTSKSEKKVFYTNINEDRSININFPISEITGNIQEGYYYFHLQLYDNKLENIYNTVCCNVIFNQNYLPVIKKINPYNLEYSGNYQIIVTDLAGNITEKNIKIIR